MGKFSGLIKKLCMALLQKHGAVYLIDHRQNFSEKLGKPVTLMVLNRSYDVEEYNMLFPEKAKDPEKCQRVKVPVLESFKEVELLKALAAIYKGGGG